jgi:hypothetical protein
MCIEVFAAAQWLIISEYVDFLAFQSVLKAVHRARYFTLWKSILAA